MRIYLIYKRLKAGKVKGEVGDADADSCGGGGHVFDSDGDGDDGDGPDGDGDGDGEDGDGGDGDGDAGGDGGDSGDGDDDLGSTWACVLPPPLGQLIIICSPPTALSQPALSASYLFASLFCIFLPQFTMHLLCFCVAFFTLFIGGSCVLIHALSLLNSAENTQGKVQNKKIKIK